MCFFEEPGHVAGVVIGVFAIINALSFACMNAKYFDDKGSRLKWCLTGLLLPVVSIIMYCYINRYTLAAIEEERQAAIKEQRRNPTLYSSRYDLDSADSAREIRNADEHRQQDLQRTLDHLGGGPASRGYAPREQY